MTTTARPAASAAARPTPSGPSRAAVVLTALLAIVSVAAAAPTILLPDVLRGPEAMNGSARGTALVLLVLAVPLLVGSMSVARRGSDRGTLLWLGSVCYVGYNAVMLLLGTPFNPLFLLYDAMLGLSIWTAIALLHGVDVDTLAARFTDRLRHRGIAVLLWVIVALNTLVWLRGLLPGLTTDHPAFLEGTGLTTLPTYVQDLAFWLPLAAVTGWWLWRRQPWGLVLAPALMTYFVLEAIGVAADQTWGHLADPASPVVSTDVVPGFTVLALVCLGVLVHQLRCLAGRGRPVREQP